MLDIALTVLSIIGGGIGLYFMRAFYVETEQNKSLFALILVGLTLGCLMSGFSIGAALFTSAILGVIINTTFGATFNPIHSNEFKKKADAEKAQYLEEYRRKNHVNMDPNASYYHLDPCEVDYIRKWGTSSHISDPVNVEQVRKWGVSANILE